MDGIKQLKKNEEFLKDYNSKQFLVTSCAGIWDKRKPKKKKKVEQPIEIISKMLARDPRCCPICGSLLKKEGLSRASPA